MKNYDRIQAYLSDALSAAERQAFETALAQNDALRQEYEAHLATEQAMEVLAFDKMTQELAALEMEADLQDEQEKDASHKAENSQQQSTSSNRWLWFLVLLLVGILMAFFWYSMNQKHSNRALADLYFELPAAEEIFRGEATNVWKTKVYQALLDADYEEAKRLIKTKETESEDVNFLLGIIEYKEKNEKNAYSTLEKRIAILENEITELTLLLANNTEPSDELRMEKYNEELIRLLWYQAFAALDLNEPNWAKANLKLIIENPMTTEKMNQDATDFLADLNSIWR